VGYAEHHPQPAYKEKAMTYEEKARAWIQGSPYVDIPVGRFTLKFKLTIDRDWGWTWEHMTWLLAGKEYWESPEEMYFDGIYDDMNADLHDMEFIDELLEAIKKKPFNQGEM
jgi:hypothetical protein